MTGASISKRALFPFLFLFTLARLRVSASLCHYGVMNDKSRAYARVRWLSPLLSDLIGKRRNPDRRKLNIFPLQLLFLLVLVIKHQPLPPTATAVAYAQEDIYWKIIQ